jgi:hypothetical protein
MPVTVLCPHLDCGKPVMAPDSARGKPVRCVHCGNLFLVPVPKPPEKGEGEAKPAPAQKAS